MYMKRTLTGIRSGTALFFLVATGAFAGVKGVVSVQTTNPTWEVVVADDVMDPPAAGVDAVAVLAE